MRLAVVGLLCALAAPAADMLGGRVWERVGDERRPLGKALVRLAPERRGSAVRMVRSDADGQWRIPGPLAGRYYVDVSRPGYFVALADGAASSSVLVDCSGTCGPVEFELERGAVVLGVVEDDQGQPLENTAVELEQVREEPASSSSLDLRRFSPATRGGGGPPFSNRRPRSNTNDLGRFRLAGLAPGRYEVRARYNGWRGTARHELAQETTVELSAGEEVELRLVLQRVSEAALEISGVVSGVDLSRPGRHMLHVQLATGEPRQRNRSGRRLTALQPGGAFSLDNLAPGRYYASYSYVPDRVYSQLEPLGAVDVQRSMSGLTLSPVASVNVAGRFELDTQGEIRGAAATLSPLDGSPEAQIHARGIKTEFRRTGLYPGSYEVEARSRELFLAGVRIGDREVDPDAVPITTDIDDLVIVMSDRYARVEGSIRPAAPRYTVWLSSDDERDRRSTDQNGAFVFDRLPPGEYTICAKPVGAPLSSPCAIERRFPVEADAVIELELNAP